MKFALPNRVPEFAPREVLASNDSRTIARDLLAMTRDEFSAAFKESPMKRAKLRGLKRNAAVVLGNAGTVDEVPALRAELPHHEPLVREHVAWALGRIEAPGALPAFRGREWEELD